MSRTVSELPADSTSTVSLSKRERHDVLAAKQRRLTIDFLEGRSTSVDLAEVSAGIVALDDDVANTDAAIERARIELHHVHLPKMSDVGVIEYDPRTRVVTSVEGVLEQLTACEIDR